MIIHVLCTDGSPLGVSSRTIWGDSWQVGVGGAELALLTMCEEWTKAGHEVVLYNNPKEVNASPFEQRMIMDFEHQAERDVLIVFRSPNPKSVVAKGLRVWWSTDQYTVGDFANFAPTMHKIVGISEFHSNHFKTEYGVDNMVVIDLPVRIDDYADKNVEKVRNRIIFSSIPDRGLENLWRIWPIIKRDVKDASLVITSDYRLWGVDARNERHKVRWIARDDIEFKGAMPRSEFIEEELKAEFFVYPCEYDELFCISAAEAQFVGAYPITTDKGALATTNMGIALALNAKDPRNAKVFAEKVIQLMNDFSGTERLRKELMKKSKKRFDPKRILKEWDEKVFS